MKLLDLLLEDVSIPFANVITATIINDLGEKIYINCEVPGTEEEKATGLMYRDSLCSKCGIYYDYVDGGFWMKNVNFPIEMVFIKDGVIVEIIKALANDEKIISPSVNSDANLEVNDNFCQKNNISVGNKIYTS